MADSNSQPNRCPCGFWGSPQTLGLCSKCYRERENKDNPIVVSAPSQNNTSLAKTDIKQAIASIPPLASAVASTNGESKSDSSPPPEDVEMKVDEAATTTESSPSTSKEASPGSKRDADEPEGLDPDRPKQKNKKRCFTCNCKLELAIREIGKCRCDYVFCQLHRLPEQHDCIFDHKSKGREEARNKMVSPKKHMGTSLKRIDSDS